MEKFSRQQLADLDSKRKPVETLVFKKTVTNKSLGQDYHFKQPVALKFQAVKVKPGLDRYRAVDILLQDTTGRELDIPDAKAVEEVAVGMKATIEGRPAEGEFVMPSGATWEFKNGELIKIVPATVPSTASILSKIVQLRKDFEDFKKSFSE